MTHRFAWIGSLILLFPTAALADAPLPLADASRARCLEILREGLAAAEFWPSMHAAEGLSIEGFGAEVRATLLPQLSEEMDARQRCGIARELVRAGERSHVRILLDVLASPDTHSHAHAGESLYKVNEIGDGALLRKALEASESSLHSLMAAAALARWGSPRAFEHLREGLSSSDPILSRTAAWILARVGDAQDLPALKAAREAAEPGLTLAYYDHALAALGDDEGCKSLVRNLSSDDPLIRVQAAEFAADACIRDTAPLLALLEDSVLDVRIRAAHALLALAKPEKDRHEEFAVDVFPADEAHPRYSEGSVLPLRDGRLLYTTTQFDQSSSDFAKARLIVVESSDEGRTWSEPRILQENIGQTNVMSASLFRLNPGATFDGPIGFLYLRKNSYSDLHAFLRISHDEGATFGEAIGVTTAVPGYHVVNNDRVTVLSTGRIVVPTASTGDVEKDFRFVSSCFLSDDGGATWRQSRSKIPYDQRGAMEPEVLELNDGRLLMHIRTQLGHIAFSESADGGETWSEAKSWGVLAPEAPSTLRRNPATGDLLLVWNNSVMPGEGHGGPRTPLVAAVSTDEGKTWSSPTMVEPSPDLTYAYTSLAFDKGRALLTYYLGPATWNRLSSRFRSVPLSRFYDWTSEESGAAQDGDE